MDNCKITKLNGVLEDDNIPVFGELKLWFLAGDGSNQKDWQNIFTKSGGQVEVSSNGTVELSTNPIPASSQAYGYIRKTQGDKTWEKFNSVYNIDKMQVFLVRAAQGLSGLFSSARQLFFDYMDGDFIDSIYAAADYNKQVEYLDINSYGHKANLASNLFDKVKDTIKVFNYKDKNVSGKEAVDAAVTTSAPNLQSVIVKGDIALLSPNIRAFGLTGPYVAESYGSINELVSNIVASGRTSGAVYYMNWVSICHAVTFNGKDLNAFFDTNGWSKDQGAYISWEGSTITITPESQGAPQNYVPPINFG